MRPSELRKMKCERNTLVKNKISNLLLVRQFALMAVKLQMFDGKTRHFATLLEHIFCLMSMLRCKRRYCCLRISTYFLRCCTMYVFSLSGQWILKMVKEKGKLKQRKR